MRGHNLYGFTVRTTWHNGVACVLAGKWVDKKQGFKGGRSVLNQDLWQELEKSIAPHTAHWQWVKGHADDADNLRCDFLANRAAREQIASNGIIRL